MESSKNHFNMNRLATPALILLGLIVATFCIYSMFHTSKSVKLMNAQIEAFESTTNQAQQTT